ncbi:MAG: metallopeptidase family protein [Elusimicrobia bacterium]|nr:metallopeptidase family protein [Elusimicrobiota bacterium]
MTLKEFEKIINLAVSRLPKEFKDILKKNQIKLIPRENPPATVLERYKGKIVFGIFIGVPYGRFFNMQTEPTRIELYKSSFEQVFKSHQEMKNQIIKTVIHEIGHYFGFSEEGIRKLGY